MKIFLNISLILGLLGIIGYLIFFNKPKPIIEIEYDYITDTIYADTTYLPSEPYPIPTPPKIVTIYEIDSLALDLLKLKLVQDSLHYNIIIQGLETVIAIHENYIKQFPQNPKLIGLELQRDTLSLGLLNISGNIIKYEYPIFLNRFRYQWTLSGLSHETHLPPTLKSYFADYFVGGGVDVLWKSPYFSFRVEKEWTRIRLYGSTQIGLLKREANQLKIGIDYNLRK